MLNVEIFDIEQKETEKWDLIPQVMINDQIYIYSGKESDVTGRCEVMDGKILTEVSGNEKTKQNNQSNFGTGYEYQMIDEKNIDI